MKAARISVYRCLDETMAKIRRGEAAPVSRQAALDRCIASYAGEVKERMVVQDQLIEAMTKELSSVRLRDIQMLER